MKVRMCLLYINLCVTSLLVTCTLFIYRLTKPDLCDHSKVGYSAILIPYYSISQNCLWKRDGFLFGLLFIHLAFQKDADYRLILSDLIYSDPMLTQFLFLNCAENWHSYVETSVLFRYFKTSILKSQLNGY